MTEPDDRTQKHTEVDRGLFGDARPGNTKSDSRTGGSLPQEKVEDRENVSTVTPEDYPSEDRETAKPK